MERTVFCPFVPPFKVTNDALTAQDLQLELAKKFPEIMEAIILANSSKIFFLVPGKESVPIETIKKPTSRRISPVTTYEVMLGLSAEMELDQSLRAEEIKKLEVAIDQALDAGDQEAFISLSTRLNELNELKV
jgi:hypothetical protein